MQSLIKDFGIILILFSGSIGGWILSNTYLKRVRDLKNIKIAINIIDNEIISKNKRLIDALEFASKNTNKGVKVIFLDLIDKYYKEPEKDFYELWLEVIKSNKKYHYFKEKDLLIINEWVAQIGRIPLEKQIKINNICIKELNKIIVEGKKEASKKVKIIRYFGVLLAFLIIIIFY
ncbi:MAG: hypothetical protein ACQEQF_00905 [Bacillota bacterium]